MWKVHAMSCRQNGRNGLKSLRIHESFSTFPQLRGVCADWVSVICQLRASKEERKDVHLEWSWKLTFVNFDLFSWSFKALTSDQKFLRRKVDHVDEHEKFPLDSSTSKVCRYFWKSSHFIMFASVSLTRPKARRFSSKTFEWTSFLIIQTSLLKVWNCSADLNTILLLQTFNCEKLFGPISDDTLLETPRSLDWNIIPTVWATRCSFEV